MCAALRGAPRSASHELNLWPSVAAKKPIHAAVEPPFADYGDHCANGEAVTVVAGSIGTAEPGTPPSIGVSRRNQAGEVGATAGNRTAALRRSVRDFADSRPEVASSGRLGPQRFRGGVAVDQPVFGGEPTVVQETPFMRYGCGGRGVGVRRQ
jgi:hypothetical protein